MNILEMMVSIDCPGCASKVKKALKKLDGVDDIDIDMSLQKITVTGWAEQEQILQTVRKTGRKADVWPSPYEVLDQYDTSTENIYNHYNYYRSNPSAYNFRSTNPSSDEPYDHLGYYYNNGHEYDYYRYGQGYADDYEVDDEYDQYYLNRRRNSILEDRSNAMFSDENVNACSIM